MKAIWHDVECGAYDADLPLWEELADEAGGPILDLGCGTGRVALHLARRGHRVLGLDTEADFLTVLGERAGELPAETEVGDARDFELGAEFGLVLAPMQLLQLFAGSDERIACLRCTAGHLRPGGIAAVAIVDDPAGSSSRFVSHTGTNRELGRPLPDTREIDGWVYSSLPLETFIEDEAIVIRRLRQTVSPAGKLGEAVDEVRLRSLDSETLESEGRTAGLRGTGRREVPPTGDHVGSTVVLFEGEAA